jgi:hypothetical protein
LTTPFLTDIDSRAAIKGSRDPLGAQPIWVHFGRTVVANLTTVSTSVVDFTALLLGFYFIERLREADASVGSLDVFLKWEQLAAYSRVFFNKAEGVRGIERVSRQLNNSRRVSISAAAEDQILSNQKTYGLWGLFTMPARASGLVDTDPHGLTPTAREFVEKVLLPSRLGGKTSRFLKIVEKQLAKKDFLIRPETKTDAYLRDVAWLLNPTLEPAEVDFYRKYLLHGGPNDPTAGRQKDLAALLEETLDVADFGLSNGVVRGLANDARKRFGAGGDLGDRIDRIADCESVLAPSIFLFGYLLAQDGRKLDDVLKEVKKQWGTRPGRAALAAFSELKHPITTATGNPEITDTWMKTAEALEGGAYIEAVDLLIQQNLLVMKRRGGSAPWLAIEKGRIKARFRQNNYNLVTKEELRDRWVYPYFLGSVRAIAHDLQDTWS